ncbi:gluconate 2-dehydrogenase subunit 3 family protein [Paraburkholderia sp. BCC1886]|uniref:gluconate 2-dehydrogenase subunit 3 family protein n=1 Tax=Paraburkholderia sp. BCC1886 TaxID=2562670 RepID=UPI001182250F|nr:gluconate 2-dehydrogenase subunit 3 family protein [Paraburkholderia sp. BCC1886]
MKRRAVIKAGLALIVTTTAASIYRPAGAAVRAFVGGAKWIAKEIAPPTPVDPKVRVFLSEREVQQVTAIFDRLIPADDLSISASEAGCVVFLDYQLAGDYGKAEWKYLSGPFHPGTPQQGSQSSLTPAQLYRKGLAEIDAYTRKSLGKPFEALSADQQDHFLEQMEAGKVPLTTASSDSLFKQFLTNVQEGFLADPIYGGNKDMVGWKMIGFPGARYDYRDYVQMKGKRIDIQPVSIVGRL